MIAENILDKRAPMAAAPMKYKEDGSVDWGTMWDSFCVLAQEGGPPHRAEILRAPVNPDATSTSYHTAVTEIVRGIGECSGLTAAASTPGWIAVNCPTAEMAIWLCQAIQEENVEARAADTTLFVPVGDTFSLKGEIKSVITAVAKTTHYWQDHLPVEVKQTLALQAKISQSIDKIRSWFQRK